MKNSLHSRSSDLVAMDDFDAQEKGESVDIVHRGGADAEFTEEFYRLVFDNIMDEVLVVDCSDYTVIGVNRAFLKASSMKKADAVGRKCFELSHDRKSPCDEEGEECPLSQSVVTGLPSSVEHRHCCQGGEVRFVEISTSPIRDGGGNVTHVIHISRDVTQRRQAEDLLRSSLMEKEVLLKEIHHRVKNNMQIISSLLSLQSDYVEDDYYASLFTESRNRIKSMALIHEKLYHSSDLARIDFKRYAKDLVDYLLKTYRKPGADIRVRLAIEDLRLRVNTALPCGLLINELVTNSLKYAFEGKKRGIVEIGLRMVGDHEFELCVRDDGKGLPNGLDQVGEAETLGLRLVSALAEGQLEGSVQINKSRGTEVRVIFRDQD